MMISIHNLCALGAFACVSHRLESSLSTNESWSRIRTETAIPAKVRFVDGATTTATLLPFLTTRTNSLGVTTPTALSHSSFESQKKKSHSRSGENHQIERPAIKPGSCNVVASFLLTTTDTFLLTTDSEYKCRGGALNIVMLPFPRWQPYLVPL